MKAVIKPAYNKDRIKLSEVVPLDSPYRITISVAQLCNFKCFFCTHSLDRKEVEKTGFKFQNMSFELFKKLADQLAEMPNRLKLVVFSGMGEPLLNKDLPKMIKYLKENKIADRVEMYSNATLLTEEITHKLVEAGLDSFKVSLEGLSKEKYKETTQKDIDFEELKNKIQYFYDHRKKFKLYIKVIDALLEQNQEQEFYDMFGNMCDEIFIEHLSDCQPLTGDCEGKVNKEKTMYNEEAKYCKVCSMLFYSIYADVEANIYPCVTLGLPVSFAIGNINDLTIKEMWNGEKLKQLRIAHLKGEKDSIPVCNSCGNMICMYHEEDDLDDAAEEILERL